MLPHARRHALVAAALLVTSAIGTHRAEAVECPGRVDAIETDRPDVTNSSVVIPVDSVQIETGVDWTAAAGGHTIDGPQARVRLGVFRCGEVIVDLPDYHRSLAAGPTASTSPAVISIKRQLFERAQSYSVSLTAGVGFPATRSRGADGYSPYLQLPWSRELTDRWSINGMVTVTSIIGGATVAEPTIVLEREFDRRGDLFVESIGDYASEARAVHTLDGGGGLRLTTTQQIDFHVGSSLSAWRRRRYLGVGYSLRLDPR